MKQNRYRSETVGTRYRSSFLRSLASAWGSNSTRGWPYLNQLLESQLNNPHRKSWGSHSSVAAWPLSAAASMASAWWAPALEESADGVLFSSAMVVVVLKRITESWAASVWQAATQLGALAGWYKETGSGSHGWRVAVCTLYSRTPNATSAWAWRQDERFCHVAGPCLPPPSPSVTSRSIANPVANPMGKPSRDPPS